MANLNNFNANQVEPTSNLEAIALRFRGRFAFADLAVQSLRGLNHDLFASSKIGGEPTTAGFLAIDLNLNLLASDIRIVLATDLDLCLLHSSLSRMCNRCNGQLYKGERTHIGWTAKEIVLPTIDGSPASGAIIKVAGITGRIRGMKYKRADVRSQPRCKVRRYPNHKSGKRRCPRRGSPRR